MKLFSKLLMFSSGALLLGLGACKKDYLDRLPSNEVPITEVFSTTEGAKHAIEGLNSLMYRATGEESFGQKAMDLANDLMGEDMVILVPGSGWYERYASYYYPQHGVGYPWSYYYQFVNNCNFIMDNIDQAKGPQADKDVIKGQAYFYLAFAYYNLSIYYQHTYMADSLAPGVPIYHHVTKTGKPRATLFDVYGEINKDLDSAEFLLNPSNGAAGRTDNSEINIDVVHGLQARVALVMNKWGTAETKAHEARQNYGYMSAAELLAGFSHENSSWIWGSHLNEEQTNNTWSFLSQLDPNTGGYAKLGDQKCVGRWLYRTMPNDSSSSKGYDIRFKWWYGESNPPKPFIQYSQKKFRQAYPGSFTTDVCYMRAAEMGFIEAEAQAHQGKLVQADSTLTQIMRIRNSKYQMPSAAVTDKNKMLIEIWHQRKIELWGEGFRYSDLQRCAVLPAAAGSDLPGHMFYQGLHREASGGAFGIYSTSTTWTNPLDPRFVFKIPSGEMNYNPDMVQNP